MSKIRALSPKTRKWIEAEAEAVGLVILSVDLRSRHVLVRLGRAGAREPAGHLTLSIGAGSVGDEFGGYRGPDQLRANIRKIARLSCCPAKLVG